jgi:hypothetical protein
MDSSGDITGCMEPSRSEPEYRQRPSAWVDAPCREKDALITRLRLRED